MSKQHYTQVKVSVNPDIATVFKEKCAEKENSWVSGTKLSGITCTFLLDSYTCSQENHHLFMSLLYHKKARKSRKIQKTLDFTRNFGVGVLDVVFQERQLRFCVERIRRVGE